MSDPLWSDRSTWLRGDDLESYRVTSDGLCWWCQSAAATTREHKFKRTDLDQMWGDSAYLLWGSSGDNRTIWDSESFGRLSKIRGAKSDVAKFKPSMCLTCNGKRSQPFDDSYVTFSRYVWQYMDTLWKAGNINMSEVYGNEWKSRVLELAKYFAKHSACSMVDADFKVPQSIIEFLNGNTDRLEDMHIVIFKDPQIRHYRRQMRAVGVAAGGLHIEPAVGTVSPSRKCLTAYSSAYLLDFIGVKYYWKEGAKASDSFYLHQKPHIYRREKLPLI
ncbi:hypothetical protein [Actinomadura algeriensis]|uniref:Uncharacterized protein n=1 Tax=Actinomadura algeriensis TaxID=1679523 RepID=A0ABR9JJ60_9ACTN|nr:hypothetical protein [Actinomadura algeriensis]MBE1530190.1 hypothetical protein [Actinomadura algeriensis]